MLSINYKYNFSAKFTCPIFCVIYTTIREITKKILLDCFKVNMNPVKSYT